MKQIYLLTLAVLFSLSAFSQTLVAKWTFPTGTATDSVADGGISANLSKAIEGIGTSGLDFTKNGFTTKAAQATGWDNGSGTKCWQVSFSTKGYASIKLSSRQQSGGNSPGPKDFILQFKVGNGGTWNNISGGTITTANDWTTSYVNNISLPADCDGQELVFVRWLMNSNLPSSGTGNVLASGISKIDDIIINADITTGLPGTIAAVGLSVYPNPVLNGSFTLKTDQPGRTIEVLSMYGKVTARLISGAEPLQVETASWAKGTYLLSMQGQSGLSVVKIIVR